MEIDSYTKSMLEKCQKAINYEFKDIFLLKKALTHRSMAAQSIDSNERLEFLGDAILDMIVCKYLYLTFYDFDEGDLSLVKSEVVSRVSLAKAAKKIELDNYFKYKSKKPVLPVSMLANVFEAIIGAIYLDGGITPTRKFILDNLSNEIETVIQSPYQNNYKSLLQFIAQRYLGSTPTYTMFQNHKSDTDKFVSYVVVGNRKFLAATGNSKKSAEQEAAAEALEILALEVPVIVESFPQFFSLFQNSQVLLEYVTKKYNLQEPLYYKKTEIINNKKMFVVNIALGGRTFPGVVNEKYSEARRLAARKTLGFLAQEHSLKSCGEEVYNRACFFNHSRVDYNLPNWYSFDLSG